MNCIKCNNETDNFVISKENIKLNICKTCLLNMTKISSQDFVYKNKLEEILNEFSKFMHMADNAKFTNKNKLPLKVRKQSILLRNILKEFRKFSLDHEKLLNNLKDK